MNTNPSNSDIQNENSLWKNDPKKALFEFVKWKAPESKYGALKVKDIYDMIRVTDPSLTMKEIYTLCESFYDMGAFSKTQYGAYLANPDYVPEGDLA